MMNGDGILMVGIFGVVSSVVLMLYALIGQRGQSVETRLAELSRKSDRGPLKSVSSLVPSLGALLMPREKANRERIRASLVQAGFYRRHTSAMFFGMKFLLMVCPVVVGMAMSSMGLMPLGKGMLFGSLVGLAGTLTPGVWLRSRRAGRQKKIRRALPDALDVIVVCLEGGLSVPAAFARVSDELKTAYPMLAAEMLILRKEMELGRSTGEAFREFADRFDADELRSMAAVIEQAERFGTSLVRTLRIQADALRLKRQQYAETQAEKAPLKLIFPTVLCIFPALYIVLMGPAGVQLLKVLERIR